MRRSTWVLAGLLALFVAEISLLVWVADTVGLIWTLALLAGTAVLGGWLWRREGPRAWQSLSKASDPQQAGRTVTDAALVMVGGILLLAPGFLTDVLGLVCLLPATRPLARRGVQAVVGAWLRPFKEQADLLDAHLRPDTVVPGETVERPAPRRPDDPTIIRGEIEP